MSDKHTQGRLTLELVESDSGIIKHLCPIDTDGLSLLTLVEHNGVKFAAVYYDDDARRLVACWNAAEGLSTKSLESAGNAFNGWKLVSYAMNDAKAQRDALLEALDLARTMLRTGGPEYDTRDALDVIDAAIAKATGETK